jgi:hypothetical protein
MKDKHYFGFELDNVWYLYSQDPTAKVMLNTKTKMQSVRRCKEGELTIGYDQWHLRMRLPKFRVVDDKEIRRFGLNEEHHIRFSQNPSLTFEKNAKNKWTLRPLKIMRQGQELTMSYSAWAWGCEKDEPLPSECVD